MTQSRLTVVMYHYVRPIAGSPYPGIKGLEIALFREQLGYLVRHYTPVTMEAVVASLTGDAPLPENAVLLTFDDGYRDHRDFVLPALIERELQGSFFVPAAPVMQRRVLDVNKLHFILAAVPDAAAVASAMELAIAAERDGRPVPSTDRLRAEFRSETRFDSADVAYVKRLLQRVLPEDMRSRITAALFDRFVTADESAFAEELYLSAGDVKGMAEAGMHIGGHGDRHYWLSSLSREAQQVELAASRAFVRSATGSACPFTFCYPYGDYDANTLDLLTSLGCSAAFTTRVATASLPGTEVLELPRLDTNDLPKDADAPANEWTRGSGAHD